MFDPSKTRAALIRARDEEDETKRGERIEALMSEALISLRQERDGITDNDLFGCGFTPEELTRHGRGALDHAAAHWHRTAVKHIRRAA